ncbi:MAG: hypothetical protein IPF99_31300 [Deltaproteobacteria bacterium]|nr:hypothetical protein [Deltaproteobacteria bacterium]
MTVAAYSTQLRSGDSSGLVSATRQGPSLSSVMITARARSVPRSDRSSSRRIAGTSRRPTGRYRLSTPGVRAYPGTPRRSLTRTPRRERLGRTSSWST